MSLHSAVARLQTLATSSTDTSVKFAPEYPTSASGPAPFAIAYIGRSEFTQANATDMRPKADIYVDYYVSINELKNAFQTMDAFTLEYARRIGGDPNLNGTVQTVIFPVIAEAPGRTKYGNVDYLMRRFVVRVHALYTPI